MTDTEAVSAGPLSVSIERPAVYVVATPIGNLGDVSTRAVAILRGVDCVLCEDTRHSRRLLDHYAITTRLIACHEHNERSVAARVVGQLIAEHQAAALISDAGTPLISDPGYAVISEAINHGVPVRSVPGPSAVIAALSICGLPMDRFTFEGFLPAREAARARCLEGLRAEGRTMVFYEAPHRIRATIVAMLAVFGPERQAVIVRELTKQFETAHRGTLAELEALISEDANARRGECVVVVAGAEQSPDMARVDALLSELLGIVDRKTAVRLTTRLTGAARNAVYQRSLELGD